MQLKTISEINPANFFRLPFRTGTRILTLATINQFTEFRKPNRGYHFIRTRKIAYQNELLTLGVTIGSEPEEMIYLNIQETELMVTCRVDTEENYLSRYAYFAFCGLMYHDQEYDFEEYFWPGFFNRDTGLSNYLRISNVKGSLNISVKMRYKGLYKPGRTFPVVGAERIEPRAKAPILVENPYTNEEILLGFCFADLNNERYKTYHYPFLVPYTCHLNKNSDTVKGFNAFVFSETDLPDFEITAAQQTLLDICFQMRALAPVERLIDHQDPQDRQLLIARNKDKFNQLFELWHQAFPILSGSFYTHYFYTFGMRNVKGKPRKNDLYPCTFSNLTPQLVFLWKDLGAYYKLELRLLIAGDWYEAHYFSSGFFVMTRDNYRNFFILNSIQDIEILKFFQQSHFRLLILKEHFVTECKDFVADLRKGYRFKDR